VKHASNHTDVTIEDFLAFRLSPLVMPALIAPFEDVVRRVIREALLDVTATPEAQIQSTGEQFIPIRDAIVLLNAHRTTMLRWEKNGLLPRRRRMGGRTGWLRTEIEAFLKTLPANAPRQLVPLSANDS
jgi:predicted DNA-binding transcriptional regulator AlpA